MLPSRVLPAFETTLTQPTQQQTKESREYQRRPLTHLTVVNMSASSSMIGGHSSFQFQASIDHAATAYIESLMDMDEQRKRGITTSYKTEEVDSQHLPPLKKLKSSHDVVNNSTSSTSTEVTPLMSNNSAELAAAQLSLSRTQPSSSTMTMKSQHTNTVHAVTSSSSKTPPS